MKKINLKNKGEILLVYLFSFMISFLNCYIHMAEKWGGFCEEYSYGILIFNTCFLMTIIYLILRKVIIPWLDADDGRLYEKESFADRKYWFVVFSVQIICWLPIWLAYYPGLFAYDVMVQIPQRIGSYDTWQPLIHTLYLQFFYYIVGEKIAGSYNIGVAFATLVQMILFSAMISYTHLFLFKIHVKRKIRYSLVAAVCFLPLFSMLSISLTKDTLFAGWMTMLFTSLAVSIYFPDVFAKKYIHRLIYIISIIGIITFRKNGLYCILLMLIVMAIRLRKNHNYKMLIYTVSGTIAGMVLLFALQTVLQATPGNRNKNVFLSAPLQQLSCVYTDHHDELLQDERDEIISVIPTVENYNPYLSDPVMFNAKAFDDIPRFFKIYIKYGMKYPKSYVKGFCLLNAGNLCFTDNSYARIYGTSNRQGIYLTDTKQGFAIVHVPKIVWLENLYEALYTENLFERVLGLNILCKIAPFFWLTVFFLLYALLRRKNKSLEMLAFLAMYLLILLDAPAALPRYIMPVILCLPQLLSVIFYNNSVNLEKI